jgi:hypothetical protein
MSDKPVPSLAALRVQLLQGAELALGKVFAAPDAPEMAQHLHAAAAAFAAAAGMSADLAAAYDRRDRKKP